MAIKPAATLASTGLANTFVIHLPKEAKKVFEDINKMCPGGLDFEDPEYNVADDDYWAVCKIHELKFSKRVELLGKLSEYARSKLDSSPVDSPQSTSFNKGFVGVDVHLSIRSDVVLMSVMFKDTQ